MVGSKSHAITRVEQLRDAGLLAAEEDCDQIAQVVDRYSLAISPEMLTAIHERDSSGAIRRQFVPITDELITRSTDSADPIGDKVHRPIPGITHRYPDRVLLFPVLVCPVYCRFCFRREVVGAGDTLLPKEDLTRAIDYIASHPEIWEVILTGGDPGILTPGRLKNILTRLDNIPHVRNIRIHTRVPVVSPERITDAFCDALDHETPVWVAIHINAVDETGTEARAAFRRLTRAGIPLLSQTVLLRGVNDSATQLDALFRELVANRVKPYYLHQLDHAPGTGHFRVPIAEGRAILETLRGKLSGVCIPTYILDIPGGHGKIPIMPSNLEGKPGAWLARSPLSGVHEYVEHGETT